MNVIINHCRRASSVIANLSRNRGNLARGYVTKVSEYNIKWVKPQKVPSWLPEKSGDLGLDITVKPTDFRHKYDESSEMKDASDIVKRMFTIEFQLCKEKVCLAQERILETVKRHRLDRKSPESKIALLTVQILYLQKNLEEFPKNKHKRTILKEKIDKRRSYLAKLRKLDYRRFEWVLEKLNLVYKPFPESPLQITRKESLRRLTENHCDKLVQEKLDAYKVELKEMQKDFYKEKAKKLAFIREEELTCGLQPSVSEEDIAEAIRKTKKYEM